MNKKVGRNDPCPCGSGKKYKNCCMLKEKENSAAKYTASGKRKFKAKVLSATDKSLSIFSKSASMPDAPKDSESETLAKLKYRMTNKDFRQKQEVAEELPFEIPTSDEASEKPEQREMNLPKPDEEFEPSNEDFRTK
ncbi:MAG: hypothetical protein S4CHLAM123_01820 [Chlamydiales bacterium]|nr:hypothetical protein [Chlamydiales bacterium]